MNGQTQGLLPRQLPMQPQKQGVQGVGLLGMANANRGGAGGMSGGITGGMAGGMTNAGAGRGQGQGIYQDYFNYSPMQNPYLQPPMRPQQPSPIPEKRNPMLDMYKMGFQLGMSGQNLPQQSQQSQQPQQAPEQFTPGFDLRMTQ